MRNMSKFDIGEVLSKASSLLNERPLIFAPFLIIAFLSVISSVLMWEMNSEFTNYVNYASIGNPLNFFKDFISYFAPIIVFSIILGLIQIFLYTGALRVVKDEIEKKETTLLDLFNTSIRKGLTVILSSAISAILVMLPLILFSILLMLGILTGKTGAGNLEFMAVFFVISLILQMLFLAVILWWMSSGIARAVYILVTILMVFLIMAGAAFTPILILAIPFLFIFLILVLIAAALVFFTIAYIIPSAVVLDDLGVIEGIKRPFRFAKENTINLGLLIMIFIIIIFIASIPVIALSFASGLGSMSSMPIHPQNSYNYYTGGVSFSYFIIQAIQAIIMLFVEAFMIAASAYAYAGASSKEKQTTPAEPKASEAFSSPLHSA